VKVPWRRFVGCFLCLMVGVWMACKVQMVLELPGKQRAMRWKNGAANCHGFIRTVWFKWRRSR
jgi:hypothetical protein